MSGSQWNEVALNGEDLSYMLDDETTPVKACGDLAYHATHNVMKCHLRSLNQMSVRATSLLCDHSERGESVEEVLPEASQWTTEFSGVSASSCDGTDQSLEGWISECLNDPEMNFSTDELLRDFSGASDIQIDISEFSNSPPAYDANILQQHCTKTPHNVVFRGRKSLIRTPTKLASSVAYPFAFIKPCGVHGDITLKDINQRIHSPASTLRQNTEDPSAYPKSAFSGKPVVGKTKIRTEGGKGSITIMRTKG
ncbi:protein XRI1 [Citrus sinensis]|nr:protein XRI1 [Citrus sinensis]